MAGSLDDQRNAAIIYTSLSSYVITASLGVVAAQAAIATFILDKRDHLAVFYIWMVLGLFASVSSIVLGGKGIANIASSGHGGTWTLRPNHDYFNYQAIASLLGMILLLCSIFCGDPKPETPKPNPEVQKLNSTVEKMQIEVSSLQAQYAAVIAQRQPIPCISARQKQKSKKNAASRR